MKQNKTEAKAICEELVFLIERNIKLHNGFKEALESGLNDVARDAIRDEIARVEARLNELINGRIYNKLESLETRKKQYEVKND